MTAPLWLVARPIAHRGLHNTAAGIFENTITAADAAIAGGFAIECDVQDTADGEAVVFHDFTLDRLTAETGAVRERKASEVAEFVIGATADRIPTLAGFVRHVAGRAPLIIEIKSRFDGDLALARRTVDVVSGYDGPIAIKSFDPIIVEALRKLAPGVPRGIVAESRYEHPDWDHLSPALKHELGSLLHLERSRPDFLSWRVADLPAAPPFLCRLLGRMPVMTWTVRSEEERRRASQHADQIVFEGFSP